jgi:branched-chain amino acid transport system substrate-binding protein
LKIGTVAIFACASLMLAPASSLSAQRDDKLAALSALASRVGHVLGAASACPSVARERIQGVADKISDVIKGGASSQQEISAIFEVFNKGSADGARAVALVQVDCLTSERQLSELENVSNSRVQLAIPAAATAQRSAFASPVLTSGVRGVAANEIRFGSSLPLTGPNKESGQKIKVGIETAFRTINEAGGINGRMLRLIPADDGYEPARTAETMKQLYERDQVFGFMGNYGTPTAMVAAPFALDRQALFYAGFSGAGVLRHDPPDRYVFNYRASYAEETEAVVRYLVKVRRLKPEQIAVFAQQDAYGDAGFAGVAKTMRALRGGDGGFILRVGYARNTVDVDPAVAQLKANKTPIKAVVMAASYRAAAKFIEKTTDAYPGLIYTNVSFVGSTSLRDELMMLGSKYAAGVIVTQVVPAVEGHSSLLLQYKNALAKFFPGEAPDYVSFEYFVAGKVLAEALKRAGPELDSERIVEAFESIRDLEVGLGTPISFSVADHQGSHRVWGTQINDSGHFEALELQ